MDEPENNEDKKTIVKRFFSPCDNVLCFDNMNCGFYYTTRKSSETEGDFCKNYYEKYHKISTIFSFNSYGINNFNYKIVGYDKNDKHIYFYFSGIGNTYNIKYFMEHNKKYYNFVLFIDGKEFITMSKTTHMMNNKVIEDKHDRKLLKNLKKAKELEDYIQGQLIKQNFYGTNKKYNF